MLFAFALLVTPNISKADPKVSPYEPGPGAETPEDESHVSPYAPGPGAETPEMDNVPRGDTTNEQAEEENSNESRQSQQDKEEMQRILRERAAERRSEVANAVQEMERIATRNMGIGEQIRVIAQNQNQIQEEAEDALQKAEKRGGFSKFLIGPNYGQLKAIEERLENHTQNLEELKTLREQIQTTSDQQLLDKQIQVMEQIKTELENAVAENQKGFSLFGWLNRMLSR